MQVRLGFLMPRSTDYPSMGFEMLEGLQSYPGLSGALELSVFTENISFGEDQALAYAKAEKLLLQDNVDIVIAYCGGQCAEALYPIVRASGRLFIFLDAGMHSPEEDKPPGAWFISLQGLQACKELGKIAGEGGGRTLMATSFFDAGFSGLSFASKGLEEAGGSMCGHYVSKHKISEFSIEPYLELIDTKAPQAVLANFSIYLSELFLKALKEGGEKSTALPLFCSPFMGEEELLSKSDFPGGELQIIVPWSRKLENGEQSLFINTLKEQKKKTATIFHLLGWEAAKVMSQALAHGKESLSGFSFDSPRGRVVFHPLTQVTYAPLYKGMIVPDPGGKCILRIDEKIEITGEEHKHIYHEKQEGLRSGWKNNYFCAQ